MSGSFAAKQQKIKNKNTKQQHRNNWKQKCKRTKIKQRSREKTQKKVTVPEKQRIEAENQKGSSKMSQMACNMEGSNYQTLQMIAWNTNQPDIQKNPLRCMTYIATNIHLEHILEKKQKSVSGHIFGIYQFYVNSSHLEHTI